jgi:hypothetical protein
MADLPIPPAVRKRRPRKGMVTLVVRPPSPEVLAEIAAKWASIRERIYGKDAAPGALPLKRDLPPSKYNNPAFWGMKPKE